MDGHKILRRALLAAALGAASLGALFYARRVEPDDVEVVELTLPLPRLAPSFNGYRIVHVSDIHMDDWMTFERLKRLFRLVNEQEPDLVAITGDFVTRRAELKDKDLVRALSMLEAPDGVAAVLGNHDHDNDPALIRRLLRKAGVFEAENEFHTIRRGGEALHIAGVDDFFASRARLDTVLEELPGEGAAILLVHEPDFANVSAPTGRFDLQLSGHSHGGQGRLPLIGAPYLPRHARRYPWGLYEVDGMLLYTNRGLGMFPPHLRFLCRPEITVLTLRAEPAAF